MKDAAEQIFIKLNEAIKNVFLNSNAEISERYIYNIEDAIIIKHFVSEASLDKVTIPTFEKLMVDM